MSSNSKFSLSGQFSPFKSLIIDINAERSYSENINENYIIDKLFYFSQNTNLYGNYANSIVLIKTAFRNSDIEKDINFNNFRKYRPIIAKRLFEESALNSNQSNNVSYPTGYGKNQQDVLINSFIAAYSGQDPERINLSGIAPYSRSFY